MALPYREKAISIIKRNKTPKNNSDFYCLNCLYSFKKKKKKNPELHKNICENKDVL